MQTLGLLAKSLAVSFYLLTGILVVLTLFRVRAIFWSSATRHSIRKIHKSKWLAPLKIVYAIAWLLFLFGLPNALFITSTSRNMLPEHITLFVWVSFTLLGLVELTGSLTVSKRLLEKKSKQIVLIAATLLIGFNAIKQLQVGTKVYSYPAVDQSLVMQLPTKGTWSLTQAGNTTVTNEHHSDTSQRYAMDFIRLNTTGTFFTNEGDQLEDHAAFGAEVYAPIAGTIVHLVDHLPDAPISLARQEIPHPAGNSVVIQVVPERYVFLAHLQQGSIKVAVGESVAAGQLLGSVGNSGHSSWPHLHMHAQNTPIWQDTTASSYPIRFESFSRKRWFEWQQVSQGYLLRNDRFQPATN